MRALDWQTLEALYRASKVSARNLVDLTIYEEGCSHFGSFWAGSVKYSQKLEYDYVPQLSLSLGRLEKQGLVRSQKHAGDNFRYWRLTPEGSKLAKGMVADEKS